MFKAPHILVWSCPIRSLLLRRAAHLSSPSELFGSGWLGARPIKDKSYEHIYGKDMRHKGSLLPSKTVCYSAHSSFSAEIKKSGFKSILSTNHDSKGIFTSHNHHSQVSGKSEQDLFVMRCVWNCKFKKNHFPFDIGHFSVGFPFNQFLQSYLHQDRFCVRFFSHATHKPHIINHCQGLPQSHKFHPIREVHQAAPRVAHTWRDCLSLDNEKRCRQRLGSNWKFYDPDKVKKGANQTAGKDTGKWASILVSLCCVEGEPGFLFTLRSCRLKGRHKGDVSFAGGKSEPSDRDVVATALREAREELGVNVPMESVWGVLKPLRDTSGMMIVPVLANLGHLEQLRFKPNPEEVEEIFTLSLSHLCNPQNRGYTNFRTGDKYGYSLPVFRNGKHRVWGLTAVALEHTLNIVVPQYRSVKEVFNP